MVYVYCKENFNMIEKYKKENKSVFKFYDQRKGLIVWWIFFRRFFMYIYIFVDECNFI